MPALAMCAEHVILDKPISGHNPKLAEIQALGFPELAQAKRRRCGLKTSIKSLAQKGDQDAVAYSVKRRWQVTQVTT